MAMNKREWLTGVLAGAAVTPLAAQTRPANLLDDTTHKVVYQINQSDPAYLEHILNSIGAVLGQYGDDVSVAIVAFAAGLHVLSARPQSKVPQLLRQRVRGMATHYGVALYACGNTLKSLGWQPSDVVPEAKIEAVGAAVLMELQQRGYAYIAW